MTLPTEAKERKGVPVYSGFVKYFPRAIIAVARLSQIGNDQHNPGKPLFWDRSKSQDEEDALMRHLLDDTLGRPIDTDGMLHATKVAWRAMARLEKMLEAKEAQFPPRQELSQRVVEPTVGPDDPRWLDTRDRDADEPMSYPHAWRKDL